MLKDKVCIVTGAASGIGLAICEKLVEEQCKVVMIDVNEELLKEQSLRHQSLYVVADLALRKDCKNVVDFAIEKFGRVDILVNVAGLQSIHPIEDFPEDTWEYMLDVMLTAPFLLTKYCWPHMKAQNWGRIIHLNSIHGLVASEFKSAYITAKHGLTGLTKVTALEGGPFGITVNSICPAYVKTPLVDKQIAKQAELHGISENEVISKIMLAKASIKKLIEVDDIAETVKFLCSDSASMITGTTITIDGGWTAA
ncbi:MAG: D-beta-hydroxybutyrate dehydrogenase [Firmicutes bacterium HGW-Firmicutes-10]|nr:MAG: D-beta-hydroxybutyrate dehydrogenase [Firmicutes bacterium HGW-Firmicutes-10]